jgi:CHASE2 domain-containing sensor protein
VSNGARTAERLQKADHPRRSPYQGLLPYREDDAAYFFGRDTAREVVIDNLLAYRLSILYGPSGVGKSSLLQAGVIRHLHEEGRRQLASGSAPEYAAVMFSSWSGDPVAGLQRAIRNTLEKLSPDLARGLPDGSLSDLISAAGDRIDGSLLIILDQFEEYFLYHPRDDETKGSFDDELALALTRREVPASCLISIREDALAQLDRFAGRIPNLLDNLVRVDHLDAAAAREAIEGPIEQWNRLEEEEPVRIEPQLVEAVLEGVQTGRVRAGDSDPGGALTDGARDGRIQTPYLQLVLTRLWEEEARAGSRVLRLETLERLGGAERIVATHLDAAMATLSRREQLVAARVLRYLVTPSGTKIAHETNDLAEYAELPEPAVTTVLERLTREARILQPVGDSRYEIYHDALAGPIVEWRTRWEARRARAREIRRLFAAVCLAAAALALLSVAKSVNELELATIDARFDLRGPERPPGDLAVVAIDDKTFQDLNLQWPFPRDVHGEVIDRIARDRPKVIAYDVQFTEPAEDPKEDIALSEAIADADDRVVLATTEVGDSGQTNILGGNEVLREIRAKPAQGHLPEDPGGVLRRVPYSVDGLKALAVVATETATGRRVDPDDFGGRGAWIDYYGPPRTIRPESFSRIAQGKMPRGFFRDKFVVIGPAAPSLQDIHPTSTSNDDEMSGAEIQASAIDTVRRGLPLKEPPNVVGVALIALLALLPPLVSLRLSRIGTIIVAAGAGGLYLIAAQLAFDAGLVLPVAYSVGALVFSSLAVLLLDAGRRV